MSGRTRPYPTKQQTNYKNQIKHQKKGLCYNCHEPRHLVNNCLRPTKKRPKQYAMLAMEVKTSIVSKGQETTRVLDVVCEEWVASEPSVLHVQGSIGNQSIFMLIDTGSTHNFMLSKF